MFRIAIRLYHLWLLKVIMPNNSDRDDDNPACWYGSSCYRKNPEHLRRFSHPRRSTDIVEKVSVKVEVGHCTFKKDQEPCKYWTAYVRGTEGRDIDTFVEKVVFHLPDSFPFPKRVIEQAPFQLSETSLTSFMMTIDVYFKCTQQTKMTFNHNLTVKLNSALSVVNVEKLTFSKPTLLFRQKLLSAGGQIEPASVEADSSNEQRNDQSAQSSNKRKRESSSSITSEEEAFSQTCASKLSKIGHEHPTQKIIAEKLISDVLYKAQLNLLTTTSSISSNGRSSVLPSTSAVSDSNTGHAFSEEETETTRLSIKTEPGTTNCVLENNDEPETTTLNDKVELGIRDKNDDMLENDDEPETSLLDGLNNQADVVRIKTEPE